MNFLHPLQKTSVGEGGKAKKKRQEESDWKKKKAEGRLSLGGDNKGGGRKGLSEKKPNGKRNVDQKPRVPSRTNFCKWA